MKFVKITTEQVVAEDDAEALIELMRLATDQAAGLLTVYDSLVASVNTDLSAANPYTTLYLWNNGATGTVNFDDVQVANTYNGPVGAGANPLPGPAVTQHDLEEMFGGETAS